MKALKYFGRFLVGFVIVVVVLLVLAVVFCNQVIESAINVAGPKMLGVPVSVEKVNVNLAKGHIALSKFYVGNPDGYSTNKALFAVDSFDVRLDTMSVFSKVVRIDSILIQHPQIAFEVIDGQSNFDKLIANLSPAESKTNTTAKAGEKRDLSSVTNAAQLAQAATNGTPQVTSAKQKKEGKKVVIKSFELNSARVSCKTPVTLGTMITIPIPSFRLHDIGTAEGGISFTQAFVDIFNSLGRSIVGGIAGAGASIGGAVGSGAESAGKAIGNGASSAVKAIGNLFGGKSN